MTSANASTFAETARWLTYTAFSGYWRWETRLGTPDRMLISEAVTDPANRLNLRSSGA